jgi:crotonobetainyl-CoA:carnitine CoA-transferase CaiB-like acyl-CoA transferase
MKPLLGIRVLDFSKVLAGPMCTQALSDYGADVIKIESCGTGDDTRGWPPFRSGDGAVFISANRNKRSLALDLKTPEAQEIAHKLAATSDVIVESFGPGVPERLGIDYDTLRAINKRIIYCSVSGFGRTGPLAEGKGYDMILQAFTGMLSFMGEPDSGPVRAPFSPVDQGTGMHALSSILLALLSRDRTGEGCRIDVSLFDTGVAFLGYMLQGYWERGTEPQRFGCAHESLCPYEAFQASDKRVLIGVASEPLWRRFCKVTGLESMLSDARFATNAERVRHRAETVSAIQAVIATRSCKEWVELLTAEGIPCSQINNFADMLSHPHTLESGMVEQYDSPAYGRLNTICPPVKFDGKRNPVLVSPPTLGQHTADILAELGYTDEEVDRLARQGDYSNRRVIVS